MTTIPPCAGKWALFDSTELIDHIEARALCRECPIRLQCADQLRETRQSAMTAAYGPAGTWAGELVGIGRITRNQRLLAEQDAKWTDRDAMRAHSAYNNKGDRSAWATRGHRIYNRRSKAKKRAAEKVAA